MTGFDSKRQMAQDKVAQPVQEPVAWGFRHHDGAIYDCISPEAHADCEGEYNVPLYDAPPKRPWVGLSEQDMPGGEDPMFDHQYFIAGMVYAATLLKEKNFDQTN